MCLPYQPPKCIELIKEQAKYIEAKGMANLIMSHNVDTTIQY